MNLALLDPFRRQVPDRIDSTLSVPAEVHPPRPSNKKPLVIPRGVLVATPAVTAAVEGNAETEVISNVEDDAIKQEGSYVQPGATEPDANTISPRKSKRANWTIPAAEDWISCHAVSFNRRGTYLAAGHLSGAVPVHDVLSRTLSAAHRPPAFGEGVESPPLTDGDVAKLKQEDAVEEQFEYRNGVTSLSWSRRSRLLLIAAVGDRNIRLVDNEHPFCVESVNFTGSDAAAAAGTSATAAATADTGSDGRVAAGSPISVVTGDADDVGVDAGAVDNADAVDDGASSSAQSRSPQPPPTTSSGSATKKRKTSMDAAAASVSSSSSNSRSSSTTPEQSRPIKNGAPDTRLLKYRILPPATVVGTESSSDAVSSAELQAHCKMYGFDDAIEGGDKAFPACNPLATDGEYDQSCCRYQTQILPLPSTVGASVQLHPRDSHAGLAVLSDGSLILFRFPLGGFVGGERGCKTGNNSMAAAALFSGKQKLSDREADKRARIVYVVKPAADYFVTDAKFGHSGVELYAATKCGTLLGFSIGSDTWKALRSHIALDPTSSSVGFGALAQNPLQQSSFRIKIPGGAAAWQLVVSRNRRLILVNSADCALRLYGADECWESAGRETNDIKPRFVFQDLVSKIAWTSCDFSGDGEYVVGGCNSNPHMGDRYDLYLWNTSTGALIDQLTGPQVELHDVAFHPTRPFVAVATSDGIVDVWGPRMDWTAFAPDFQALPINVEYVEREDEFDVVVDSDDSEKERKGKKTDAEVKGEGEGVDVVTVDRVPVFDSDTEDEDEVFKFESRIVNGTRSSRGASAISSTSKGNTLSKAS